MKTCFKLPEHKIKLEQRGKDSFRVTYFLQIKDRLCYADAALELGACIMHALACDGKLEPASLETALE